MCEDWRDETAENCPADCSDSDNDGVYNQNDQECPSTPAGNSVATTAPHIGCSCTDLYTKYGQNVCGMRDCDYLDTTSLPCRDYHDVPYGCSSGHCLATAECSSFTNAPDTTTCTLATGGSGHCNGVGDCVPAQCTSPTQCGTNGIKRTGATRIIDYLECGSQAQHEEAYYTFTCVNFICSNTTTSPRWLNDGAPYTNSTRCSQGQTCTSSFTCTATCTPSCAGKTCGQSDGCDATCQGTCAAGTCTQTASGWQCVVTYYRDADGDGYGNPSVSGSTPGTGYVGNSLDCDDADAAISPADQEVCNAKDDDCDGLTDAADASMTSCGAGKACACVTTVMVRSDSYK